MRLWLIRTGGLAGLRRTATIDTETLDPARAEALHRLVEAADLTGLSEPTINTTRGADRFRYTLTVEDGDRRHSVSFEEEKTPERLRPLVEALSHEESVG